MKKFICNLLTICFWLYMILLLYFLFFSEKYGRTVQHQDYQYNLELFKEIKRFYFYRDSLGWNNFVINIAGNILAFCPFGFLVAIILREKRKKREVKGEYIRYFLLITCLGALFSFSVECCQLATKVGCFDVDDIFLNTVGVIIGYMFYVFTKVVFSGSKKGKRRKRA